jgi:TRAP-type uncharacterized transport system substrate-binding protein
MGTVRFALTFIAATLLCAAVASAQQETLRLGTAAGGGTYNVYGDATAKVLTEKAKLQVTPSRPKGRTRT